MMYMSESIAGCVPDLTMPTRGAMAPAFAMRGFMSISSAASACKHCFSLTHRHDVLSGTINVHINRSQNHSLESSSAALAAVLTGVVTVCNSMQQSVGMATQSWPNVKGEFEQFEQVGKRNQVALCLYRLPDAGRRVHQAVVDLAVSCHIELSVFPVKLCILSVMIHTQDTTEVDSCASHAHWQSTAVA